MPQLDVTLVPSPDQVVVRVVGDADLCTVPVIADALARAAGLNTRQVVVDVAGTRFWDCSCLHALATFTAEQIDAGRDCRIVGAMPTTRRLVGMAYLSDRLRLDGVPAGPAQRPTADAEAPAHVPVSRRPVAARAALATAGHAR